MNDCTNHDCGESCLGSDYIERMERALAGPRWTLPSGLSAEQIGQYITDCSEGKIPPDARAGEAAC
jgi:hypothetical protein